MPADYEAFDDFFRRKEREALPPQDAAGAHWEALKNSLPARRPRLTHLPALRLISGAAAAVLLVTISVWALRAPKAKVSGSTAMAPVKSTARKQGTKSTTAALSIASAAGQRTLPTKPQPATFRQTRGWNVAATKPAASTEQTSPSGISSTPAGTQPTPVPTPDSRAVFASFFSALHKPAQVFLINTDRDTMLRCVEGTELFIPAGTFATASGQRATGSAEIRIREFYALTDIIGEKLSTTSGEKLLETGGMLHIDARASNEALSVRPGAHMDLNMPAQNFNPMMQLFSASARTAPETNDRNSTGGAAVSGSFDWLARGQGQAFFADKSKLVPVLNLQDHPNRVVTRQPIISFGEPRSRTIATFSIPYNSPVSVAEMKALLEERYKRYYDEIRVRREWKPLWRKNRHQSQPSSVDWWTAAVGDSIYLPIRLATQFKYITREDSIRWEAYWQARIDEAIRRNKSNKEFLEVADKYRFKLDGLGWINCDRFYETPASQLAELVARPEMTFDDAFVYSILIFKDGNVALPCEWKDGRIRSPKIPVGEAVSLVCLGVKNGKAFTCIKQLRTGREPVTDLKFEESSPGQFKEQLRRFGTVGNRG
jgi:hypothetical protein